MPLQTVQDLTGLLELLQQPAFCLRQDGQVFPNRLAETLAPAGGLCLDEWLGACRDAYRGWNRTGGLSLTLPILGQTYLVTVQPLEDGTLFLLSPMPVEKEESFGVAAQVMRQPLSDLSLLSQRLSELASSAEEGALREEAAKLSRNVYRLSRITANLADLERLRSGQYQPRLSPLELSAALSPLLLELADLCQAAGRGLEYRLPGQPVNVRADQMLLERALLNLFSNAIKYGDPAEPIRFWCDLTSSAVLLRVQNRCLADDGELLSAAFSRLHRRGALPDPTWGVGLGLPLARAIAQLHGGTVAMELSREGVATATLSLSRRTGSAVRVEAPIFDYTGGMRRSLVELSDVLPSSCYAVDAL